MSSLGSLIGKYDIPVCKGFKPKVRNDQLCYEVDLDKFKSRDNIEKDLKSGLVFFMDYNEDRQVELKETDRDFNNESLVGRVDESHDDNKAFIYLNTIG